jgi:hypothetical protein
MRSLIVTFYAVIEKLEKKKKYKYKCVAQLRQEMEANQGNMFNGPSGTFH